VVQPSSVFRTRERERMAPSIVLATPHLETRVGLHASPVVNKGRDAARGLGSCLSSMETIIRVAQRKDKIVGAALLASRYPGDNPTASTQAVTGAKVPAVLGVRRRSHLLERLMAGSIVRAGQPW
jgi:hypothetical protein